MSIMLEVSTFEKRGENTQGLEGLIAGMTLASHSASYTDVAAVEAGRRQRRQARRRRAL